MTQLPAKLSLGFAVLALAMGCQKANPTVTILGAPGAEPPTPIAASAKLVGQVTLGSDAGPHTAGNYMLKGRVNFVAPADGTAGSYKMQGTVRF